MLAICAGVGTAAPAAGSGACPNAPPAPIASPTSAAPTRLMFMQGLTAGRPLHFTWTTPAPWRLARREVRISRFYGSIFNSDLYGSVMRAIVIGGGIGGVTAALALSRAGIETRAFEQAAAPAEVGAGITLWSN